MNRTLVSVCLAGTVLVVAGCLQRNQSASQREASSPSAPSAVSSAFVKNPRDVADVNYDNAGWSYGMAINFPPRDQAYEFRLRLESAYRDTLRRTPGDSFVDAEGTIVWVQEYMRYRYADSI